jgi:2-(1,2-epoxy-1,2-dihydrophenyl)acetyl-CoA isomerase
MSMVLSERRGSIAILTLNNPERYNALGGSLLNDLSLALDEVLGEPRARAVVLTGAGKGFARAHNLVEIRSVRVRGSPRGCAVRSIR